MPDALSGCTRTGDTLAYCASNQRRSAQRLDATRGHATGANRRNRFGHRVGNQRWVGHGHAELIHQTISVLKLLLLGLEVIRLEPAQYLFGILEANASVFNRLTHAATADQITQAYDKFGHRNDTLTDGQTQVG